MKNTPYSLAVAAAQLILAGYAKDEDINAELSKQGLPPLTARQINRVVNQLNSGRLRHLDLPTVPNVTCAQWR
jgi:hypothetical protein